MDATKATKRRKITDKTLPNVVLQNPEFAQDSRMYQDLLEMERKLDWTMTRKKVEIQDSLARNPTTSRTLRLFLSHTVSSQIWQTGGEQMANFETGEGIPAWSFRIEGRLLEVGNQRSKDKAPTRKFSTFIKKMIVELDRDPSLYPEGNIVEWPRATGLQNPVLDGFTVRRTGDAAVKLRIILYPDHYPEQYKVSSELGDILGIKEESRVGVIQTLWNYIKLHGLQDKVDRRMVRADEKLAPIFRAESIAFQKLPDVVNQYLSTPDPVILFYTIDPSVPPPDRPTAWDIEVKAEDVFLKNRMSVMLQTNRESAQNLVKLDEEIALHAQSLHNSHLKRTFLESFAKNPAEFIQTWLESQSRDLETILGSGPTEGLTVRQEELRRSEFFKLPWVEELGKLRQWAGEVISSREKTTVTEEFHELELDIEKRKLAAQKLYLASEDYHHALSKKKESESLENPEKLLPIDTLGVVMIVHGEEHGEDSALGTSLVKLGRAHCKIATLQEAYALTFHDTYIASLESFSNEIKEYEHQRKKLESRRLSLDAALTKQDKLKSSKKEKDKVEADEEVERAQARYDEAAEDVRAYMHAIQENEIDQLRELTGFLESEVNFVKQYLEVLQETQAEWSNTSDVVPRRTEGPMHTFSRSNSTKTPKRPIQKRTWSSRSNPQSTPADSSDDERAKAPPSSRPPSSTHRRTDSAGTAKGSSRPPSRPSSRASRKRSDSLANPDSSMRISVAGWANSAVSSVRGKKKEKFASLQDDDNDHPQGSEGNSPVSVSPSFTKALRRKSQSNEGTPKESSRILKPSSLQEKKVVRALYDFSGSSDELSFKAGDEIVVINEVLDEWWMGLLDGKQGLFPTPYTEAVSKKPVLLKRSRSGKAYEEDTAYIVPSFQSDDDSPDEGYRTSDLEEEDAYKSKPLNPSHNHGLSNNVDDDEDHLMPSISRHAEPAPPALPMRRASTTDKAPPPPPPRRSATPSTTPKIPPRRPSVPASSSSSKTPSPKSSLGYDASPFDSVSDLSLPSTTPCKEFRQNPFKPKGMCSNCFEQHA
ncbi:BAR-domain-containing protein [Armillaria mellea]|nr:BAR-domain-containing protein [Armillaria mellea]